MHKEKNMIESKKELKEWLDIDKNNLNIRHFWIQYLTGSEFAVIYSYMWILRHLEYYISRKDSNKLYFLPYLIFYILHRRWRIKTQIHLGPGDAEKGFHIVHLGFFRSYGIAHFGENCTVLPMTLFGKKTPDVPDRNQIIVGDNCYFGTGVTVLAPCKIGNNVVVAAGSVITCKEIPDNVIVAGVPARIIKNNNKLNMKTNMYRGG